MPRRSDIICHFIIGKNVNLFLICFDSNVKAMKKHVHFLYSTIRLLEGFHLAEDSVR